MSRWTQLAKAHFSFDSQEGTTKTPKTPLLGVLGGHSSGESKKPEAANDPADQAELEREMVAERAAIQEFDGNLERDLAERMGRLHASYICHHWICGRCVSASQGRGSRCETGAPLWAAYQDTEAAADATKPKEGGVSK